MESDCELLEEKVIQLAWVKPITINVEDTKKKEEMRRE